MKTRRQAATALVLSLAVALPAGAALPTVPLAAAESASATGASGMLQAGLGMLVVLGLIFLCAWLARRLGLPRFGGSQVVKVISTSMVGQRERVVVVEVGATWLVLGVTASQINALHTLPAQALPCGPEQSAAAAHDGVRLFAGKLREAVSGTPRGH